MVLALPRHCFSLNPSHPFNSLKTTAAFVGQPTTEKNEC
jgi:hypothetical protein